MKDAIALLRLDDIYIDSFEVEDGNHFIFCDIIVER